MKCPVCNQKTVVCTTRTSDSPRGYKAARLVKESVSWYTSDWVARIRSCSNCGWSGPTVELPLEDLKGGWKHAYPHKP